MVGNDAVNYWDYLGLADNTEYQSLDLLIKDVRSEIVGKADWADREYGTSIWILAPLGSWVPPLGEGFSKTQSSWKFAYGPLKEGTKIDRSKLIGGAGVEQHSPLKDELQKKYCVVKLGTMHSHPHAGDPAKDMEKFQKGEQGGRPPFSGGGFDGSKLGDIDYNHREQYPYRSSHQMIFLLVTGPSGLIWWYQPNKEKPLSPPDTSPGRFGPYPPAK